MSAVVLVSGGVDSLIARDVFYPDALPLFIDQGHEYVEPERAACRALFSGAQEVTMRVPSKIVSGTNYVPARNLLLACIGVRFGEVIVMAGLADDVCEDKNPAAFAAMSEILTAHSRAGVSVTSPLWSYSKAQAVALYLHEVPHARERLMRTFSCYHPTPAGEPCADCEACFRRSAAFVVNGIPAPIPSQRMRDVYAAKITQYIPERQAATREALAIWGRR